MKSVTAIVDVDIHVHQDDKKNAVLTLGLPEGSLVLKLGKDEVDALVTALVRAVTTDGEPSES